MRQWFEDWCADVAPAMGFSDNQIRELLVSSSHSQQVRRQRATVVIARVRLVAAVFAILTPLWILVDFVAFPYSAWLIFAGARLAASALLIWLVVRKIETPSSRAAYGMLIALLAIPPGFYLLSLPVLDGLEMSGAGTVLAALYGLLPFVVIAGLSIFPLTVFEVGAFSAPVFLLTAFAAFQVDPFSWEGYVGTIWLLLLIIGVAMLSGLSQLNSMISLVNKASIDTLTGAHTRRSGGETLEVQFRVSEMHRTPFALAFFDIDNFKAINDTFGHDVGDQVLRQMSNSLRTGLRKGDTLIRWGGEEFVLLMGNTDASGLETVMRRIVGAGFGNRPDGTPLTASVGVAERLSDDIGDWPELVELADHRMYEAKTGGKARIVLPGKDGDRVIRQLDGETPKPALKP
ncbi:MAG: diguanylate cyclase [Magnetovibrionaceae bacterium]